MWCCVDMAGPEVSLRVWALPSMGSTEWRKLCLDLSLFWMDLALHSVGFLFVFLKQG